MSVRCVSGAVGGVSHRGGEPARPSLTDYSGESPMRKPRLAATRTIVLAALTLAVIASCGEPKAADQTVASQMRIGHATDAAGGTSGFAGRDAPLEMTVPRAATMSAPMAAKAERAPSATNVSSNADAVDPLSLGAPPTADPAGTMIVRHGQASIEVQKVEGAVARIRQTAGQFGGFVGNTSLVTGKEEQKTATLELRVPSAQFDAVVGALNQPGKVSDVLTVEQELARVRQEAERYEARIRFLEHRASLSSLAVSLHEKVPLIEPPRGHGPIAEAFAEAWTRFVAFTAWLIASLGILVPAGAVIGIVILVTRRLFGGGTPPKTSQV